eukprot:SAG31_NODE_2150_length_6327_cov_4.325947_1_plen_35_part_00
MGLLVVAERVCAHNEFERFKETFGSHSRRPELEA